MDNHHLIVSGVSGSGKSRFVRNLVASEGTDAVVLDTRGSYACLFPQAVSLTLDDYRQQIARCSFYSPVCFDLLELSSEPLLFTDAVGVILSWLEKAGGMRLVVVDDVDAIARIERFARELRDLMSHKERYRFVLVTEKFADLVSREEARAVIAGCSAAVLLKQSPANIQPVQDYFKLSPRCAELLLYSVYIGEGLLLTAGGFLAPVRVLHRRLENCGHQRSQ